MKSLITLIFLLLSFACFAEVTPATTQEGLIAQRAELAKKRNGKLIRPVTEEVAVSTNQEKSIMDSSSYLVGALGYTLIPNGSAPHVSLPFSLTTTRPEELTYMNWSTFIRTHRTHLQIIPITDKLLRPGGDIEALRTQITSAQELGATCVTTYKQLPARISQTQTPPQS